MSSWGKREYAEWTSWEAEFKRLSRVGERTWQLRCLCWLLAHSPHPGTASVQMYTPLASALTAWGYFLPGHPGDLPPVRHSTSKGQEWWQILQFPHPSVRQFWGITQSLRWPRYPVSHWLEPQGPAMATLPMNSLSLAAPPSPKFSSSCYLRLPPKQNAYI